MLYGANGYTGALIAEAVRTGARRSSRAARGCGRSPSVSACLGARSRSTTARACRAIDGVSAILLAAGPFSKTSAGGRGVPHKRVHYLDITGEWPVFGDATAAHARSRPGVVLMPGVGFDVVPSDCLAAARAKSAPGATNSSWPSRRSARQPRHDQAMIGLAPRQRSGGMGASACAASGARWTCRSATRAAPSRFRGATSRRRLLDEDPNIETYMALPRRLVLALRAARPPPLLGIGAVSDV